MNNHVPKFWIFAFIAVAAILIGLYITTPQVPKSVGETQVPQDANRVQTFDSMLLVGDDAIYLENQLADQTKIVVGFVVLSQPGYVVIYDDEDGVPGSAIGESGLLADGGEHILLRTDERLIEDAVYYAVLHHDNGDGRFSALNDDFANDSQSSVILMTFIATDDAVPEEGAVNP